METGESFLHQVVEIYFTIFPTGFFLQILNVIAEGITLFWGALGVDVNVVGF
jgi:hypothetical protein